MQSTYYLLGIGRTDVQCLHRARHISPSVLEAEEEKRGNAFKTNITINL